MAAISQPVDDGGAADEVSTVLRELQRVAAFAQQLRSANDELKHELSIQAEASKTSDEERSRTRTSSCAPSSPRRRRSTGDCGTTRR